MLKEGIEPRLYQQTIFNTAITKNTLCVLPTGMGKTLVAELTAIHRLQTYKGGKILFLAPTRPLVQQHLTTFERDLDFDGQLALFTGNVSPEKRATLWESSQIIFSTPQGLENDVISGRISLKDVSLLIVDEAHRAVGDYAYVFLAEQYMKQATHARILALTASPGSDKETVEEICRNLTIEEIELRSEESPDVKPYIQEIDIEHIQVVMPPEFKTVHTALKRCYEQRVEDLKTLGTLNRNAFSNKTTMLKAQGALHAQAARGQKSFESLKSMSLLAEALKVQHALELIETQGVSALAKYVEKLRADAVKKQSKAVQNIVRDVNFKSATIFLEKLQKDKIEHPKLRAVKKIILRELYADKGTKVIIFNQYRNQAQTIKKALDTLNIESRIFVGQMKKGDTGMTQKEQHAILESFRNGEFNVLIATSVAEEGLDIPKVDTVLFYEPIPSAIRTVQRRGRTGRLEKGRVIMLVTEGTRDVAYKFAARNKEKRMHRVLVEVKRDLSQRDGEPLTKEKSTTLAAFEQSTGKNETVTIVADHREKVSGVLKELLDMNIKTSLQQLQVGDYLLSDRVVVEYKRVPDFVDSIIDGRLLHQLRSLRKYRRPLIIIEGEEDIYSMRKIHPNAILGMLSTIMISYNIPLIFTKNSRETASLLSLIAKKEHKRSPSEFQQHGTKPATAEELLEYVVSSLPQVGTALGKRLLERFKTIKGLANASEAELQDIEKLGPKKAKSLHDFFNQEYKTE